MALGSSSNYRISEKLLDETVRWPLSEPDRHLRALTGLRAIAAGWVVIYHASFLLEIWVPPTAKFHPVTSMGFLGVDLFFALSGFVLCHRYLDDLGPRLVASKARDFYLLRIARLYPVHLTTLIVIGLIASAVSWQSGKWDKAFPLSAIPQYLILVHAWANQQMSWNVPSWSVSLEWLAYLFFPLLAAVLFRIARSHLIIPATLLIAAVAYAPLLGHIAGLWTVPAATFAGLPAANGVVGVNILRLLAAFVGGCCAFVLARHFQRTTGTRVMAFGFGAILLALVVVVVQLGRSGAGESNRLTWVASPFLVFIVAYVGLEAPGTRWLTLPRVVGLGLSSYSLYMTHWLVFTVMGVVPGITVGPSVAERLGVAQWPLPARLIYCVGTIALCYVIAHLCWRLVEEPARRALRRVTLGRAGELPVEERSAH